MTMTIALFALALGASSGVVAMLMHEDYPAVGLLAVYAGLLGFGDALSQPPRADLNVIAQVGAALAPSLGTAFISFMLMTAGHFISMAIFHALADLLTPVRPGNFTTMQTDKALAGKRRRKQAWRKRRQARELSALSAAL
jgi:hypothetical protein